jgi:hypothetical protein
VPVGPAALRFTSAAMQEPQDVQIRTYSSRRRSFMRARSPKWFRCVRQLPDSRYDRLVTDCDVVLPGEAISNLLPAPLLPQQPVDPLQIASSEATVAARARSTPARALDGNARTLAAVPPGRYDRLLLTAERRYGSAGAEQALLPLPLPAPALGTVASSARYVLRVPSRVASVSSPSRVCASR